MTVSSCFSEKSQHTGMSICNFLCLCYRYEKSEQNSLCVYVWVLGGCQRTARVCPVRLHVTIFSYIPSPIFWPITYTLNWCKTAVAQKRHSVDLQYCSFRPHYDFSSKGWPRIITINISNVCTHSAFCHTQHNLNLCLCVCPLQGELLIINSGLQCLQCIDVPHPVFNPVTPDLLSWFKTLCHLQVDVYC